MPRLTALLALLALLAPPALATGQAAPGAPPDRVFAEAGLVGVAGGFDVALGRGRVGFALGYALDRVGPTLRPGADGTAEPHFFELLHLAAFARLAPDDRVSLDIGMRLSAADLWPCTASDCLPVAFAGVYVQPMLGSGPWQVGARLAAGWIAETVQSDDGRSGVLALDPLLLRWTPGR